MKPTPPSQTSRHLSVVPANESALSRLTRAQVAARLGVSISTVRRFEGSRLHPQVDHDDVRWFDAKEVVALAATLANEPRTQRRRNAGNVGAARDLQPSGGEIAALVFERLEQRQSLPEIVVGVRIEPAAVRALFEQWCLGLIEGQLQMAREPRVPRDREIPQVHRETLVSRLAELPADEATRISVGRFRGPFQHGDYEYPEVIELGGFHVAGPCSVDEITRRFGPGDYRVTAYGFDPPGLRWELLVKSV